MNTIREKEFLAIETQSLRDLMDYAKEYHIRKDDIVTIIPTKEGYAMIFYY